MIDSALCVERKASRSIGHVMGVIASSEPLNCAASWEYDDVTESMVLAMRHKLSDLERRKRSEVINPYCEL
jgi:hypothetical protein